MWKIQAAIIIFFLDLFFGKETVLDDSIKKKHQNHVVAGAKCHLCASWVNDAHPKGEFVVCDICRTHQPSH